MNKPNAQPGDICIMLVPADFQGAQGRDWQLNLQQKYGGSVTDKLHLMVQRFTPGEEEDIEEIEAFLKNLAAELEPIPILIHEIFTASSGFRGKIILKGATPSTPEITAVSERVNREIENMSCKGHYSFIPRFVTLLEGLQENIGDIREHIDPVHLFQAEGLLTSIISKPGSWEIRKIFLRRSE